MKRTLLLGLLLASVSAFAYAGPHGDKRMLFDGLNLTAAQKQQLKTIRKEARDERIKLRDQMDDLREKADERVMAVLTDEQKKAYLAKKAEWMQMRKAHRCDHDTMPMRKPKCD